jgi:hypothetical protein
MKRLLVLTVLFVLACGVAARAQKKDEMPPLPARLLEAKKVFLLVDTDWAEGHTKNAYKELKKWGRFEIVANREDADLIFSITNRDAGAVTISTGSVSGNANYATGTAVGIPVMLHDYFLRVYDREKGTLLFASSTDQRMARSAETKRLIGALRRRMEPEKKP